MPDEIPHKADGVSGFLQHGYPHPFSARRLELRQVFAGGDIPGRFPTRPPKNTDPNP
jgi:hypothetical protein